MKHSLRARFLALLLVAVLPLSMGGCYGTFPLTKIAYRLNGDIGEAIQGERNGVASQIIFWLFLIFPIYELANLGDAIILNLIEFWTGAAIDVSSSERRPDGSVVTLASSEDGREATLTVSRDGVVVNRAHLTRDMFGDCEMRDEDGRVVGRVTRASTGELVLSDARGRAISTIPAEAPARSPAAHWR